MDTHQSEPYQTAQTLKITTKYVIGHYQGSWVCQRVRDGLFIGIVEGELDNMIASLWRLDISRKDVCFV